MAIITYAVWFRVIRIEKCLLGRFRVVGTGFNPLMFETTGGMAGQQLIGGFTSEKYLGFGWSGSVVLGQSD
jgi:hypothetical protein